MDKKYEIHTHTHTHTHNGLISCKKKNEISPFITICLLEGIMPSKINQTEKDKYYIFRLYIESKKKSNNRKRLTENKLVVIRRDRVSGEGD